MSKMNNAGLLGGLVVPGALLLLLVLPIRGQETPPEAEPLSREQVREWVREDVESSVGEVEEDFQGRSEQVLAEARDTRNFASEQVSRIIDLVSLFFTVLTAILAVAAALGVAQFFRLRRQAVQHIAAAEDAAKKAQTAADRIDGIRARLVESLGDIPGAFDTLPSVAPLVTGTSPGLDPGMRVLFEDRDKLLIVADQLGLMPEPEKAAEYFRKVARYWRCVNDLPRALSRLERAKELAPANPAMSLAEARTLATWAAHLKHESGVRDEGAPKQWERYLQRALTSLDEAEAKAGGPKAAILHYRAWCKDEQGRFDSAERLYRVALEMTPDRRLWEFDDDAANLIRHNLACCLCNAGKYEEAVAEVAILARTPTNKADLLKDPELSHIRETPPWRERFDQLVSGSDSADGGDQMS